MRSTLRLRAFAAIATVAALAALVPAAGSAGAGTGPDAPTGPAQTRIVGGKESAPGAWPSQVAILHHELANPFNAQFCGGTVLSASWVLSAGHCFDEGTLTAASDIDVLSETTDLTAGGRRVRAAEIVQAPGWNDITLQNDFALVRLDTPVNAPGVVLADQGAALPAGTPLVTTGWGNVSADEISYPTRLREVDVPVISDSTCRSAYPKAPEKVFSDSMFCAGYMGVGGKDSCNGDSGGPISRKVDGAWVQVGVVSWGIGCARPNLPGVYSRVSLLSNWMKSQIRFGPFRDASGFVRRQYVDFYGRQPTSSELAKAVATLEGTAVSTYLAQLEAGGTWQSRAGASARLYRAFFHRDADTGGLKTWEARLRGGWGVNKVADFFATSEEFTNTYGALDDGQFVDLVYSNVLDRAPDAAGRAYWVGQLGGGTKTRGQVMAGFSESGEFKAATRARTDVTTTFFALLRRVPTNAEYASWIPKSNVELTRRLAASFSYASRF